MSANLWFVCHRAAPSGRVQREGPWPEDLAKFRERVDEEAFPMVRHWIEPVAAQQAMELRS